MPANALPKVRVRTYRHGLGDCHLVRFRKGDGSAFHLLIDCGVVNRTKNPRPLMSGVAQNISDETGKVLDLVVATHAHTDHLSGFTQAEPVFADVTMKRLWLSWMDQPGNQAAKRIQNDLVNKLTAVRAAVSLLRTANREAADRVQGLLDFFGPGAAGDEMETIIQSLRDKTQTSPEYQKPGTTFLLPEVPNVRVYVLGPPTKNKDFTVMNPRKSKHEGYELALSSAANGFAAALGAAHSEDGPEASQPFEARCRLSPARAKRSAFFKKNYFGPDRETRRSQTWRQIDSAWLEAAEQLALYLDTYTNNTSLALAFEFLDSKEVLLFPGDAQIGSWLTWHKFDSFKQLDGSEHPVSIRDLFSRTVFYKASHHASHNGTLSGLGENQTGLEQMTHRDLVCVVPVDRDMSKAMRWDRTLPWTPLLNALREKTRGRLVLTDSKETPPQPRSLKNLSVVERRRFKEQVKATPKWVDYTL